jgi:D-alanyl-D-alanine carboxypeptidase
MSRQEACTVPSHRADTSAVRPGRPQRRDRDVQRPIRHAQPTSLSVPQVGIASALGLATIAAPLTGMMAGPPPKASVNQISSVALARPEFPLVSRVQTAVDDLRLIPDESTQPAVPGTLAAPRDLLVTRASRGGERSVLPGCDGIYNDVSYENGRLPASVMCTLWDPDQRLRADAAVSFAKLNVAFKQRFGKNMCITDAYRSLAAQIEVKAQRGSFAAQPGTSEHGWGLAVDLCDGIQTGAGAEYQWMRTNAPRYGWDNPTWARSGGSGPNEPWHWEYLTSEGVVSQDA